MNLYPDLAVSLSQTSELPLYKEWAYDFERNCLKTRNGKYYLVEGQEALKIWIYKALKTERYRYPAYPRSFGSETYTLIGEGGDREITESEMERYVQEALLVCPYIIGVGEFEFQHEGSRLTAEFTVMTIYGDIPQEWSEDYG